VIDKFVTLSRLYNPIQSHNTTEGFVFENNQILMIRLFMIEHFVDSKVLTELIMQRLLPHRFLRHG